jgi:hypothetical protein
MVHQSREVTQRLPDWRARLLAYIARVSTERFAYGSNDCSLFAAGAVEAMLGIDYAVGYRGRYSTLDEGMAELARNGFDNVPEMLGTLFPRIPISRAAVGDLAIIKTSEGPAIGVVQGPGIYLVGFNGLRVVPLAEGRFAFRVGT